MNDVDANVFRSITLRARNIHKNVVIVNSQDDIPKTPKGLVRTGLGIVGTQDTPTIMNLSIQQAVYMLGVHEQSVGDLFVYKTSNGYGMTAMCKP